MGKILFQAMTLSPWHPSPLSFSTETCLGTSPPPGVSITPTEIVRVIQSDSLRPKFIRLFPSKFGERLTDSRSLAFDQFPDHNSPRDSIANLADKLGFSVDNEPLDWTPCYPRLPTRSQMNPRSQSLIGTGTVTVTLISDGPTLIFGTAKGGEIKT